ncbi:hypothetical protein Taro_030123 [Colocasia esculenta]|uniref:Uncharacterized protein n=1 Tax=Colocasia esculenta TaxID=4460 RepID=A0A843VWZ0_COLES|nr:hypothetical protein [Colocasia esculenta]
MCHPKSGQYLTICTPASTQTRRRLKPHLPQHPSETPRVQSDTLRARSKRREEDDGDRQAAGVPGRMANTSFSHTTTLKEKTDESLALAKNFLENMNDELDESALWASLMNKFAGRPTEEIEGQCSASITEFTASMLGLLPTVDYSDLDKKDSPPPIIATDPATREFIATLREGLPDLRSTKGQPWSSEEHCLFLLGMKSCGKGDWRSISKYFVLSRTPTQIASHAQKFFTRQEKEKRKRALKQRAHDTNAYTATRVHYATPYNVPNAFYQRSVLEPVPAYNMHNGINEGRVDHNRQYFTMPTPAAPNIYHRPLMPAPPQHSSIYYPNAAAAMAQDRNVFGRL